MSIQRFQIKKSLQQKISMITCYDYPSAKLVAQSDIDCVLVGDSVAMTVHGYPSTVMATIEMMIFHTQAVARGLGPQFLVADMPFLAHRGSRQRTNDNALRLLQSGAHAVKIEGADSLTCQEIEVLVEAGVPVMGHIGLQPQSVLTLGGYKVQGRGDEQAQKLIEEALRLQFAGCFAIVIECVPAPLAQRITQELHIPTIGIGAGNGTDGQVLVWHDMLGLQQAFLPKFVKQYQTLGVDIVNTLNQYHQEVSNQNFPSVEHVYE
jgi:3-methyl-2-oxobutanoate hydroxymethyltransferase